MNVVEQESVGRGIAQAIKIFFPHNGRAIAARKEERVNVVGIIIRVVAWAQFI